MKRLFVIISFCVVVVFHALLVFSQRQDSVVRCSLDGSRVLPQYEVSMVQKDGTKKRFSCILSAQIWFRENEDQVSLMLVTDELTGKKIEAGQAFYVASDIVTTSYTGNKIHVFSTRSQAARHARQFNGTFVKNPFHARERIPVRLIACRPYSPDGAGYALNWSEKEPIIADGPACFQEHAPCGLAHPYRRCCSEGYHSPPYRPPKPITHT